MVSESLFFAFSMEREMRDHLRIALRMDRMASISM
jgi:hypothetical protein